MNPQKRKIGRRFLCVLVAAMVSLLLVVLPFAQTLDASDSGRDSGRVGVQDSGAAPDFEYEDADMIVTANLSDHSAIPANAEFHVEPITKEKDNAAYNDVETQIDKEVQKGHQHVTGFRAYDIYFTANGTRYEPKDGDVTVTIQYKNELFGSTIKKSTDEVKVLHLKKSGDSTVVEDVTKAVDVKDLAGKKVNRAKLKSLSLKFDSQAGAEIKSHAGNRDTVEFVTKSFSPVAVVCLASGNVLSAADIESGLGIATNFAVFAQNFTLANHMEGNVAVNVLKGANSKLGDSSQLFSNAAASTFTLNISVSGIPGQTYKVGIYKSANGTNPFCNPVSIVMDSSGQGSQTVSGLNSQTVYYAYLLDSNQKAIIGSNSQGITGGGSVTYSGNDSYMQTIACTASAVFQNASTGGSTVPQIVTFGNQYLIKHHDYATNSDSYIQTGNGADTLVTATSTHDSKINPIGDDSSSTATIAGTTFPIDFTAVFKSLSTLSSSLGNEGSFNSSSMWAISVAPSSNDQYALRTALTKALNYGDLQNDLTNKGIPLGSNQYLVVNVDCKNINSVTIPACPIGGTSYSAGYTDTSSRVIWNFYNSSGSAYTGTVSTAASMLGTILAPSASVIIGPTMCGAIYADTVTNQSGEIHKWPFRSTTGVNRDVSFTVPGGDTTSVTVKKVWSDNGNNAGKRPTQITFDLLQNGIVFKKQSISGDLSAGTWPDVTFSNLPLKDASGKAYTYTISEEPVPYYTPNYGTATFASSISTYSSSTSCSSIPSSTPNCTPTCTSANITITNTYTPPYVLPETGGGGTAIFYTAGGTVLLFGAVLAFVYRLNGKRRHIRKRRRNSLNE